MKAVLPSIPELFSRGIIFIISEPRQQIPNKNIALFKISTYYQYKPRFHSHRPVLRDQFPLDVNSFDLATLLRAAGFLTRNGNQLSFASPVPF